MKIDINLSNPKKITLNFTLGLNDTILVRRANCYNYTNIFLKLIKIFNLNPYLTIDNHYKTVFGPVRNERYSGRVN